MWISSLFLLLVSTISNAANANIVTRRYKLYHNLGSSSFVERGAILLSNDPTLLSDESSSSSSTLTAILEKQGDEESSYNINANDVNEMLKQENKMYTVKVVDEESGSEAMASVEGCNVRRANFREEIALTISHTGTLLSISYNPLVSVLAPPCSSLSPLPSTNPLKFQTTLSYTTSTPGMALPLVLPSTKPPAGLSFYPRSKTTTSSSSSGNGENGGGGNPSPFAAAQEEAKNQNQSFLRKYWYILLPLFIMGLTSGVEEPPPPEGPGGAASGAGGAARGGGAAAAGGGGGGGAAMASGGGGGQPVRRRGKRG